MSKKLEILLCNSILIKYPYLKQYTRNKTFNIKYESKIIDVLKDNKDVLKIFNSYVEHYNNRKRLKENSDVKENNDSNEENSDVKENNDSNDSNEEIILLKKMNERFKSQRNKVIEKLSLLQDKYDKLEKNYENFKIDYKRVVEERDKEKLKNQKKHKDLNDEYEILKKRNKQYFDKYGHI